MYVVVLMLPLAFAAMVWPARRVWAARLVELLVSLILSKFVIVAVLSLAGAALASGSNELSTLLTAMALVIFATFAPWVLMRILPFTELAAGAAGMMRHELPRISGGAQSLLGHSGDAAEVAMALPERLRRQAQDAGGGFSSQGSPAMPAGVPVPAASSPGQSGPTAQPEPVGAPSLTAQPEPTASGAQSMPGSARDPRSSADVAPSPGGGPLRNVEPSNDIPADDARGPVRLPEMWRTDGEPWEELPELSLGPELASGPFTDIPPTGLPSDEEAE